LGIDLIIHPDKAGEIGRIAPDGTITVFPLPAKVTAGSITTGPDGNLWFTEYVHSGPYGMGHPGTARIGRMTPSGVLTEFPLPGTGSAGGLTKGPDGALWFVADSSIDRISTAGVVTAFPVHPATGPGPSLAGSITAGPDGNLWFSEWSYGDSRIGRISPAGVVTEFHLPSNLVLAQDLVAGPDGNVWFTEAYVTSGAVPKVGRITPSGLVTEFSPPTPGAFPGSITAGPDGNLWFTENPAYNPATNSTPPPKLVQLSPTGSMTEYAVPAGFRIADVPDVLTAGPDGNLWLGEPGEGLANSQQGGGIGEVVLPKPPTVLSLQQLTAPRQPSQLVLTSSGDLNPASAQNLGNYTLIAVGPRGRSRGRALPLASAVYDVAAHTVTINVRGRLDPRSHYRLAVNGSSPSGLANVEGVHLSGNGRPGSDFVAIVPGASRHNAGR
jgi:streptogramin lyase